MNNYICLFDLSAFHFLTTFPFRMIPTPPKPDTFVRRPFVKSLTQAYPKIVKNNCTKGVAQRSPSLE